MLDDLVEQPKAINQVLGDECLMRTVLDHESRLFEEKVLKLKGGIVSVIGKFLRPRVSWKAQKIPSEGDVLTPLIAFERDGDISSSLPHTLGRLVLAGKWNVAAALLKEVEQAPGDSSRPPADWMNSAQHLLDFFKVHGEAWNTSAEEFHNEMHHALNSTSSSSSSSQLSGDLEGEEKKEDEEKESGGWDDTSLDDLLGDSETNIAESEEPIRSDPSLQYALCCKRICSQALNYLRQNLFDDSAR